MLPIHEAQILTYMKLAGVKVGSIDQFQRYNTNKRSPAVCSLKLRRALRGESDLTIGDVVRIGTRKRKWLANWY